jgi:hypothetical protein
MPLASSIAPACSLAWQYEQYLPETCMRVHEKCKVRLQPPTYIPQNHGINAAYLEEKMNVHSDGIEKTSTLRKSGY